MRTHRRLWNADRVHRAWYDRKIRPVRDLSCGGGTRIYLALEIRRVDCKRCGKVKQETLDWLAANRFYTKRFAFLVGRRCRTMTINDVAEETRLDWKTIKNLYAQYMCEQLRRAGSPTPKVVGIDEISIRKGHTYRIVVSDLERRRPIWFGGKDRSEESMDAFYQWLGPTKSKKIRLAVAVRPIQRADYRPPLRRMCRGDICGSLLLPAEGVVDVARLDALHHVVIEIGPALGTSQLPPDQLIIPLALLDHSGGGFGMPFRHLGVRCRMHDPMLGGKLRVVLQGRRRRLSQRTGRPAQQHGKGDWRHDRYGPGHDARSFAHFAR